MNTKQKIFLAIILLLLNFILMTLGVTINWERHSFIRAMAGAIMILIMGINIGFISIGIVRFYDYLGQKDGKEKN